MKKLLVLIGILLLTGCNDIKKPELIKEDEHKNEISTSYNINLDNIEDEYKEVVDKYLNTVPINKVLINENDAYSGTSIDKINKIVLISSVTDIYKKDNPLIEECESDTCSLCYMDDCILVSLVLEKVKEKYKTGG